MTNPTSKQPKHQSTSWEDKLSVILWKHTEKTSVRVREAVSHKNKAITLQIADEHKELSAFIKQLLASSQRELLEKMLAGLEGMKQYDRPEIKVWLISEDHTKGYNEALENVIADLKSQLSGEDMTL